MTFRSSRSLRDADDVTLLEHVRSGDKAAFAVIMERHQDLVFAVSLRLMGNREAALDATQETFITVFRKADKFRAEAAFSTWLYRVATNTCYDLLRKQRRRQADPLPDHLDPTDIRAEDGYTSVELRPAIEAALAALPAEFRTAVVLADISGLSLAEVADVVGAPIGTVKSRIFRGRKLLAQLLGNLMDISEPLTDDA